MSQDSMSTISTPTLSDGQSVRYQRRSKTTKIEKTNDEFKEHERILMAKRNDEVNNSVTKKCHGIWNQYIAPKPKPNPLRFDFTYPAMDKYLAVCDQYEASQHKDPKQKWWNNQKASEMSQGFLPAVLNACDEMGQFLGSQLYDELVPEFTNYCIFELIETAITSVFSTMRSGSNEVFLRTSFQYSKSHLRKKLVSYFSDHELRPHDLKSRKKKDLWCTLVKEKKERLLRAFLQKRESIQGPIAMTYDATHHNTSTLNMPFAAPTDMNHANENNRNNNDGAMHHPISIKVQPDDEQYHTEERNHLPPSVACQNNSSHFISDNASCSTTNNTSTTGSSSSSYDQPQSVCSMPAAQQMPAQQVVPAINWSEVGNHSNHNAATAAAARYTPYQTVNITPYSTSSHRSTNVMPVHQTGGTFVIPASAATAASLPYASHRECTDCMTYISKLNQMLAVNQKLQQENAELKQFRHQQYVSESPSEYNQKYRVLLQMNNNNEHANSNTNNRNGHAHGQVAQQRQVQTVGHAQQVHEEW
eukprot:CAMPEP_0197039292 /NCGR_PEP_ID=MMETSP1384-20130603/16088_1 /TAXON_ID=29189 /ORGANISM="Ammonia sp." /LENGTH=530 /DNA_ID=CAMNT_0042469863 /DNA_START=126 /DNA_END=1715 /DNA_ORIENTATION=+